MGVIDPIALKKIWMDGKIVAWPDAKVHVLTHALHYATAIFEGIRCYSTRRGPSVFRLTDHLARLYRGAKVYHIEIPYKLEQLRSATFKLIKENNTKTMISESSFYSIPGIPESGWVYKDYENFWYIIKRIA